MAFELTKEELMVQKMTREFAQKELVEQAAENDKTHSYPAKALKKMGELGYLGMLVKEGYGGDDAGTVSYALALMEIAAADASCAVIMSVHDSIGCGSIQKFGTEEQKKQWLEPMARGDFIGAFCLTEPEAGSDPQSMETTAERDGDDYIINGIKRFITTGKNAGVYITITKTDPAAGSKGITAFLLDQSLPGFIVGRVEDKMGQRGSDTTDIILENCRVPASRMLGKEGEGFMVAMSSLEDGRIGVGSIGCGIAMAALGETIKYAKQRKQFGRFIAENQAIRFMIADMKMKVEAARLLILNAASKKDRGESCALEASMAKCYATDIAQEVCGEAIQIHGGYGYLTDYPVERYYRDARITTIYEGTNQIQRIVIANEILGKVIS
ncbi:MAG: acyl-CoA dehydrogenase family protein [Deltaproteobacteria bacterium]|nr:acyl-CoA dehydrogenase family protein [Deltaproteobacteria bacterium]